MFGDSPNDLLNNLNEEHPLVVAVEYISKEESADVAAGSASAKHGVTGILAVQGAFAEHAAMLDRLGARGNCCVPPRISTIRSIA